MTTAEQKTDQIYARLRKFMARDCTLAEVVDTAVRMELEATAYNKTKTAQNLGVSRTFITDWLATQRKLAATAVVFLICACLCPAGAQPFPAARLSLAPTLTAAPSNAVPVLVTNRIEWPEFTNKFLYLGGAARRTFLSTNTGNEFEIVLATNPLKRLAAISNYTVLNGFTLVATTTNRFATVTYPRHTRPAFRVLIQFTDGYLWDYGIMVFPTNPALALLTADIEGSTNLTSWQLRQRFSAFLPTTNRSESFRARLHLEPLATNAALVFHPTQIAVTNR